MPLSGEYEPSTSRRTREQVELYERSGGAEARMLEGTDLPVVIVTSVGAKSGKLRKTALMRVEHEGEYALVASLGGAPKHPVWYFNLVNEPHIELQDGADRADYEVRIVEGEERQAWWERSVAAYPPYEEYQQKTQRQIPVFVARRSEG